MRLIASRFPNTKVVLYIRKQDDWILFSWQQWGHKEGHSFEEWCDYCMDTGRPNFLKTAKILEKIYGSDNLRVVPLNRSTLKCGDLLEDFCHHAKITHLNLSRSEENIIANTSLNPYFCEILSLSPNIYPSRDDESVKELLLEYGIDSEQLLRRRPDFISPKQRSEIMNFYQKDNQLLHSHYFSEINLEQAFPFSETYDDASTEESINREILGIQMALILALMKRVKKLESKRPNSRLKSILKRLIEK